MNSRTGPPVTVDEYIASFPEDIQAILQKVRDVVLKSVPEADERVSYNMAGYYLNGGLVWFGGFKNHVGVYPVSAALDPIQPELSAYKQTRGGIQFPYNKPIPYELIGRMVNHLVEDRKAKER